VGGRKGSERKKEVSSLSEKKIIRLSRSMTKGGEKRKGPLPDGFDATVKQGNAEEFLPKGEQSGELHVTPP